MSELTRRHRSAPELRQQRQQEPSVPSTSSRAARDPTDPTSPANPPIDEISRQEPASEPSTGAITRPQQPEDATRTKKDPGYRESSEPDVIIYTLSDQGCVEARLHIKTAEDLGDFLLQSRSSTNSCDFLLLFEDISDETARMIDNFGVSTHSSIPEHFRGRINDAKDAKESRPHIERLQSTLFDQFDADADCDSLTWWSLFTHSRDSYVREKEALDNCEADTRKTVVPHFEWQVSDTHRSKKVKKHRPNADNVTSRPPQIQEMQSASRTNTLQRIMLPAHTIEEVTTHRLSAHTYRPHRVISETIDDMWGVAGEERITCQWFENIGSTFYVVLFDKPRSYRQVTQVYQRAKVTERALTSLRPAPVLLNERAEELRTTFLPQDVLRASNRLSTFNNGCNDAGSAASNDAAEVDTTSPPAARRRRRYDRAQTTSAHNAMRTKAATARPESSKTTRLRFIDGITKAGLLQRTTGSEVELFTKVELLRRTPGSRRDRLYIIQQLTTTWVNIAMEDWSAVLSQMIMTLDGIDAKMSDNTSLQDNAHAWRSLLCSWRVSLAEFVTRLEELKEKLQVSHSQTRPPRDSSPLDENESRSIKDTSSSAAVWEQEDMRLLQLHSILLNGASKIEQRVDRTFQVLMSSMSIIESEKAIKQGVAITRLTELAFFFIPLSFAATFFSMQIKEYTVHQPRMGHFFAMGISLLLFLYTTRAIIRSTFIKKTTSQLTAEIRRTSRVPGTEEIPTRIVASYLWGILSPATQSAIIVFPVPFMTVQVIAILSPNVPFKLFAILHVGMGSVLVFRYLNSGRRRTALGTAITVSWILSVVAACTGGKKRPNPAILGLICVVVTTVCGIALAQVAQHRVRYVWKGLFELLLPLWMILLPFSILLHYYNRSHWRLWQLILGVLISITIFGSISGLVYSKKRWMPQLLGIGAFVCGIPILYALAVCPVTRQERQNHFLRDAKILTYVFSGTLFAILAPITPQWRYQWRYRHSPAWWYLMCFVALLALPLTLTWYLLPAGGHLSSLVSRIVITVNAAVVFTLAAASARFSSLAQRINLLVVATIVVALPAILVLTPIPNTPDRSAQAKISVVLGSFFLLGLSIRVQEIYRSDGWRVISWAMTLGAAASWVPLCIWETDWKAFDRVRGKQGMAITLTILVPSLLVGLWLVLWKRIFSETKSWKPIFTWGKKRRRVLLGASG